ncbi:SDR family NAD(P)-dependent oxidoreductase [Mucilaginibacter conchicola]|uniref:SDR family NAD(P)-dependent oxidoreductase n=1 Tax=Mucilaginibacter conchicola TaxID=2303333 RepID=A0A372NQI8_9SPHI|nr:oxidoreductase [Mucilaginibacter conchicola]RFZ91199.1 SDR family NAD(P)-dependent oxidoreductase [Mucilaginibacter conchicola]
MWTANDMPDQSGKTALITGANSGIGFETALALYQAGAHVILAGRNRESIENAVDRILSAGGKGRLDSIIFSLSSLREVKNAAEGISTKTGKLDILINNAGVMTPPAGKTEDGFEQQFGINFLAHFVLTAQLLPILRKAPGSRVVTVSSGAHQFAGSVDLDNVRMEKDYDAGREYAISKLADLQFMLGLQQRIEKSGLDILSVGAHPGVTASDLSRHMAKADYDAALEQLGELMPAWQGALPSLYAATAKTVKGGGYYGPDGERELRGYPAPAVMSEPAKDIALINKLWKFAEEATGTLLL